ncbi:MAG TPA: outer membrane protein assembly factor BamD [Gemmatimonadales bacterium]|nr:outer membrane protein assembly factor BamD [Gemmatimonadales bacterium]
MTVRRLAWLMAVVGLGGGGGPTACSRAGAGAAPTPVTRPAGAVSDSLWKELDGAFRRGRWADAQRYIDELSPMLPALDLRYYRLHFIQGEVYFAQGNQLQAVREFRRVADEQPEGPLAADALVRAGDANSDLWRKPELDPTYGEAARAIFEEVLARYPGTAAARRAGLRLAELTEKFAQKEFKNAVFYYRFKAWDSAILMFRSVIASYPRSSVVPEALERLVRAYQILGYEEDVKETCAYITQYHPAPGGPARLCK